MARSIRSSCQSWCGKPNPGTLAANERPVIACLHNLEDAFTGHAGMRCGPPAWSCARSACATASRCRTLDGIDGVVSLGGEQSVRDIDPIRC